MLIRLQKLLHCFEVSKSTELAIMWYRSTNARVSRFELDHHCHPVFANKKDQCECQYEEESALSLTCYYHSLLDREDQLIMNWLAKGLGFFNTLQTRSLHAAVAGFLPKL